MVNRNSDASFIDISAIEHFLMCQTPTAWLDAATSNLDLLLIDHANCEMKAASSAMSLIYKYPRHHALVAKMAPLAREELLHFEKVLKIMQDRGVNYHELSPSRYAKGLLKHSHQGNANERLVSQLIIGAIIEARSCERFARLIPLLDEPLADFYVSLVKSEARHFEEYLSLAEYYAQDNIEQKTQYFLALERELILSPDDNFRFHSGVV